MTVVPVRARLRVAVIGAGIGGLCTAAALIAGGADVAVYDQAQDPEPSGFGFGLQLAPNATRLLRRLGILDRLAAGQAVGPDARELRRWDDGTLMARTPLGETCAALYGAPYLAVLRSDLLRALHEVVGANRVRPGHRLTGLVEFEDRVDLLFSNGSTASADVVIGADGLRSTVRTRLSGDQPIFSGHRVYRGLAPADGLPPCLSEPRIAIWMDAGQHCVVYPVAGRRWVNFAATVPASDAQGRPDRDLAMDLAAAYAGWDPVLRAVLSAAEGLGVWALYDREPLQRWSTGRVTVVGDAAHPMLPFLAQGANQAVEDAVALAALLEGASSAALAPRLALYQAVRADRTAVVAQCSRRGASGRPEPAAPRATSTGPRELAGHPSGDLDWLYGYDIERALTANRSPERFGQRRTGCVP